MPVAGRGAPTRDLLKLAEELRMGIDWRRAELFKGKPAIDATELAVHLTQMEGALARVERELEKRGKAIVRAFRHEDK